MVYGTTSNTRYDYSNGYLIGAHQTRARADTANKNNNIAIFHNLNLQKYYVEIDSVRYPRDNVLVNYEQNDYIEQYKDLNLHWGGLHWGRTDESIHILS